MHILLTCLLIYNNILLLLLLLLLPLPPVHHRHHHQDSATTAALLPCCYPGTYGRNSPYLGENSPKVPLPQVGNLSPNFGNPFPKKFWPSL